MDAPTIKKNSQINHYTSLSKSTGQKEVEQSAANPPRIEPRPNFIEGEVILANRSLESDSKDSHRHFFLEAYSIFFKTHYKCYLPAQRIFCGSQYARASSYLNYVTILLDALAPYHKGMIDNLILNQLQHLFNNIQFPSEININIGNSLIAILNIPYYFRNDRSHYEGLLRLLGHIAIAERTNTEFYNVCWNAIEQFLDPKFIFDFPFCTTVRALVTIDSDGTRSFPILTKFLDTDSGVIANQVATLLGMITIKENIDAFIYNECLSTIKNLKSIEQLNYALDTELPKLLTDPKQLEIFSKIILEVIKKCLRADKRPAFQGYTRLLINSFIKILIQFPEVGYSTIEAIMDSLINQIKKM